MRTAQTLTRCGALSVIVCVLIGPTGCGLPPEQPERELALELPDAWRGATVADGAGAGAGAGAGTEAGVADPWDDDWWRAFGGDELVGLVEEALGNNPDLHATAARLAEGLARVEIVGADSQPQVDVGLGGQRAKRNFLGFPVGPGGGSGASSTRTTIYDLSANVSWEVDLWGRLAAAEGSTRAEAEARWADLAGARLSLVAATLKAWFALAEAELQTDLALRTRNSWSSSLALVQRRYNAGLRPALDVRRLHTDVAAAEANLAVRERQREVAVRYLERLVGRVPRAALTASARLPDPPGAVPSGLPAELIARRPDLAAAERRLLASELAIDASRADFYPKLVLTGSAGTSSESMSDLLDGDFSVWSIVGRAVQPLFQGGRLAGRVRESEARADQALALFTDRVLVALNEVENALAAERWLVRESAARIRAASEAERARELAADRYARGLLELDALLDTERAAFLAEGNRLAVRRARMDARVDLYLALGGGFRSPWDGSPGTSPETPASDDDEEQQP